MNKAILLVFSLLMLGGMLAGCRGGMSTPTTPSTTHMTTEPSTQAATDASTQATQPSIAPSSGADSSESSDAQHGGNTQSPSSGEEGNPGAAEAPAATARSWANFCRGLPAYICVRQILCASTKPPHNFPVLPFP